MLTTTQEGTTSATVPKNPTLQAQALEVRRLIRASADSDKAVDDGCDFFAVQGAMARSRLEQASA